MRIKQNKRRAVEVRASEEAKPIPSLHLFALFILSGLLGLFGIRRLANRWYPGGGNRRCDCDAYRPDTLRGGGRIYLQKLTRKDFSFDFSPHLVIFADIH